MPRRTSWFPKRAFIRLLTEKGPSDDYGLRGVGAERASERFKKDVLLLPLDEPSDHSHAQSKGFHAKRQLVTQRPVSSDQQERAVLIRLQVSPGLDQYVYSHAWD
jgi:hypothetical protein